jgi:hypothetical protein
MSSIFEQYTLQAYVLQISSEAESNHDNHLSPIVHCNCMQDIDNAASPRYNHTYGI